LSERKVAQGKAPIFVYRMDWQSPVVFRERKVRAAHGVELSMVFDSISRLPGATGGGPKAQAIAGKMSRAWAAFAHNANSDAEGIPHWPAFTANIRATMLFNDECKVVNDPDREERLLANGNA
jgi:para-nitrobenzyl esterase